MSLLLRRASAFTFLLVLVLATAGAGDGPVESGDPLAAEVARWSRFLKDTSSTDDFWIQVRDSSQPILQRAEEALRDGRRLLALQRLAVARDNLAAWSYLSGRPSDAGNEAAAFEAEWVRLGKTIRETRRPPSPKVLDGVTPAALRGLAEASLFQVRVYYDASLEYGRNTMPTFGLFYLGVAQGQRDFANLCRSWSAPSLRHKPSLRPLGGEIDALERDLLAVYRPPVSIDRHKEFIQAHAALKEARELDAAGLRYGALQRYLEAARRTGPLRAPAPAAPDAGALATRLRDFDSRLSAGDTDHTIGRLFLEAAQADLAAPAPDAGPAVAATIADDVLPRYFAALEPPRPEPPRPSPRVTVTMVRWPYT
jgi:hypothetical protein